MRHHFLVVTVKKGLKSVYIYRSYYKNELGGPFFGTPCISLFYGHDTSELESYEHQEDPVRVQVSCLHVLAYGNWHWIREKTQKFLKCYHTISNNGKCCHSTVINSSNTYITMKNSKLIPNLIIFLTTIDLNFS